MTIAIALMLMIHPQTNELILMKYGNNIFIRSIDVDLTVRTSGLEGISKWEANSVSQDLTELVHAEES